MNTYTYILRSDVLQKVVSNYIDYVTNPKHEWRQHCQPSMFGNETVYNFGQGIKDMPLNSYENLGGEKIELTNLPKPQASTATRDVIAVCNYIFRVYRNRRDDEPFQLPSQRLHKLSEHYKWICRTLANMYIIYMAEGMKDSATDKHAHTIYNILRSDLFHLIETAKIPKYIAQYIKKNDYEIEHQEHLAKLLVIEAATSKEFVLRYNQSLKRLSVRNKDEALTYIRQTYSGKEKEYRESLIHKLTLSGDIKELSTIDDNGRFYHLGTQLTRDIKQFTNIKYILDCKNSHLLLFNYFITYYYIEGTISINHTYNTNTTHIQILKLISQYLYQQPTPNTLSLHILADSISKNLNNKNLQKSVLAKIEKIPDDVWAYMWKSAHGELWDDFEKMFDEERWKVKENMFGDVFYSYHKTKASAIKNKSKYLDAFIQLYPNVFSLILNIKRSIHEECKKMGRQCELRQPRKIVLDNGHTVEIKNEDDVMLPHMLMRLESRIFTDILAKLFKKRGFYCFGIHDAICVLNDKMSVEEVQKIMLLVYYDYGLVPTLDVQVISQ